MGNMETPMEGRRSSEDQDISEKKSKKKYFPIMKKIQDRQINARRERKEIKRLI